MSDNKASSDNLADDGWLPVARNFATLAVHAGYEKENKNLGALVPPITISANYEIEVTEDLDNVYPCAAGYELGTVNVDQGYLYVRTGSLSRKVLEEKLAALDGGKYASCYSSGLAAISAVLSLLSTGDRVISSDDIYGGTRTQMGGAVKRSGIHVDFVDLAEDAENDFVAYKKLFRPETKMVFLESPANPTLRVFDIKKISCIAHEFNKDVIVVVDNSCLTSYFQRPLSLGADIVHYSLSKYANGHADLVGGALVTNNDKIKEAAQWYQQEVGAVLSPFDCYLVTRGLKTLPVRLRAMMESSIKVAEYLRDHPQVEAVFHPGLPTDPYHALAKKQSSGHSGLLAFRVKGGAEQTIRFLNRLKLIKNAGSFGGCESLALLPHKAVSAETRLKLGITDNFVRLAVGLEETEDLIEDLAQALQF